MLLSIPNSLDFSGNLSFFFFVILCIIDTDLESVIRDDGVANVSIVTCVQRGLVTILPVIVDALSVLSNVMDIYSSMHELHSFQYTRDATTLSEKPTKSACTASWREKQLIGSRRLYGGCWRLLRHDSHMLMCQCL
ncbi:unnamed protein product [Sphacelaria rigidula]